jgi:hypothetical protein
MLIIKYLTRHPNYVHAQQTSGTRTASGHNRYTITTPITDGIRAHRSSLGVEVCRELGHDDGLEQELVGGWTARRSPP